MAQYRYRQKCISVTYTTIQIGTSMQNDNNVKRNQLLTWKVMLPKAVEINSDQDIMWV